MVRTLTYLITFGVIAGFLWAYREGFYRGQPFPYNTFLFLPNVHFSDLTDLYPALRAGHPYSYIDSNYPPFSYILCEPFLWLGGAKATALWAVVVVGGLGTFAAWELAFVPIIDRVAAVVVLTIINYPFLIAYDRGNIDVFVPLLLALTVWSLQKDRTTVAALAIGAAAAIKVYPAIFALLFLARGQSRPLLLSGITALGLTFVGSVYYNFDLLHALSLWRANLSAYNRYYVIGNAGLGWGCSLWGPLKMLVV